MSLQAENEIMEAAEHLPEGATLIVPQVSWDDYERLLEGLGERSRFRVSYDCGRLEIVTHGMPHGAHERLIEDLVTSACEMLRLKLEKRANATWKRRALSKGAEADASYYIGNVERVAGKLGIEPESAPPPDIVVEIDLTSNSRRKFSIYAALGIPEIWRYDGNACVFYQLSEGRYLEIAVSRFIPGLTGKMLADAMDIGRTQSQDKARSAFRRTLRNMIRNK